MNPTAWLDSFFLALLRASWQASVLILLVFILRWALRKALPPEWRVWFWMLVLVRLALPFSLESSISIFNFSSLRVPTALHESAPARLPLSEAVPAAVPDFQPPAPRDTIRFIAADAPASPLYLPKARRLSINAVLAIVWFFGVIVLGSRVFLSHRRLLCRLRSSRPSHNSLLLETMRSCARELGLRRSPLLIETDGEHSPAIFGMLSPKLLFPSSTIGVLTEPQLRCVMLHELCHLRRRDVLLNWLATALQILHWFNPLVWLASGRFRADRELACDARALGHLASGEAREYGNTIIRLMERFAARSRIPGMVGISDNFDHLRLRLAMIGRFARRPFGLTLLAISGAILLGLLTLTDAQAPVAGSAKTAGMYPDLFLFQACTSAPRPCRCDPPAAVKAAIEKATPTEMEFRGPLDQLKKKLEDLRAVTAQYPREVAAHLAYQAASRRISYNEPNLLASEYRDLAGQHPDDAFYQFLYGNALMWRDRLLASTGSRKPETGNEGRRWLMTALQKNPAFVWPHLSLGRLDSMEGKAGDAVAHLRTFLNKCPCNLEAYELLIREEPAEQAQQDIPKMMEFLRRDPGAKLDYYHSMWDTRFRITPIPEYAGVRKDISADLAEIRKLNRVDDAAWWSILGEGYKLAWDQKGLDWVRTEQARRLQNTPYGFSSAYSQWMSNHPYPTGGISQSELAARRRALLDQTASWVRKWPDDISTWTVRFSAVAEAPEAAPAEADAAIEGLLRALEKNPGSLPVIALNQPYLTIASYCAQRGRHLELVPGLIEKALQAMDEAQRRNIPIMQNRPEAWCILVEAYSGLKQFDKARATLAQMKAYLAKQANPSDVSWYQLAQGRLAEAENRKAEVLSLYQSILRDRAERGGGLISMTPGVQPADPVLARASELWKELRKPDSAWQSFMAELQAAGRERQKRSLAQWQDADIPLPDFRLTDARGKTWQLSELKGKTTFIQVWAVWMSRFNDDLKSVQELYDQVKDREDVVILAFNADEYPEQIEGFLKGRNYSFPIIPAYRYVQSITPFTGSRQSWIVDKNGKLRAQLKGNISTSDFVAEALNEINQVAQLK